MLPFRRVLFPIDYSASCDAIVPYVKELTRHFHAELTLVHAYGPQTALYDELMADPEVWPQTVRTFEESRLKKFASEAFPATHVELRAELGEAAAVIEKMQEQEAADLIMMPTRGHGPFRRFLLGSVTAKVLHDSSAALWTGTGSALEGHEASPQYRSILCALDSSDEAETVLRGASNLAHSYHAELHLIHVIPPFPMAVDVDYNVYRKELLAAAEFNLRELKGRLGVDAPQMVTDALLIDGIRAEALHRKADLLVVGRGEYQRGIAGFWSTLYPIIRESPCPVLSV